MTDHLYYHDSFLYNFEAKVQSVLETPRPAVVLDRSAFYPTSGGQIHDTGAIVMNREGVDAASGKVRVVDVVEAEDGHIVHYLDAPLKDVKPGTRIRGEIDPARRRDHMQQHSAQHVLSAAFVHLFHMPTVSFHMADDYCSIDLDTASLSTDQVEAAEKLANEIVSEDRTVDIRFATHDEAAQMGLRKLPPADREKLRLIAINDFDLSACGGTHVNRTGQIGSILLRKTEKVRQGFRVEFVAGQRAVSIARRDFSTLTQAAALFSAQIFDVPQQARKSLEETRLLRKQLEQSIEDLAESQAKVLLAEDSENQGRRVIVQILQDRELSFLKLLAQKLTRQRANVVALLASKSPQPALVFSQSAGQANDMNVLLKETVAKLGGKGGGSKDLAQGGISEVEGLAAALAQASEKLKG